MIDGILEIDLFVWITIFLPALVVGILLFGVYSCNKNESLRIERDCPNKYKAEATK